MEFQLNRKFLRRNRIQDVFAFQKLIEVLPGRNFYFATLDLPKVLQHLGAMPATIRRRSAESWKGSRRPRETFTHSARF